MKILKDQSVQTTTRAVDITYLYVGLYVLHIILIYSGYIYIYIIYIINIIYIYLCDNECDNVMHEMNN